MMTETLTTEQVEEILAGCEGVTPGPWDVSYDELGSGPDRRPIAFLEGPDETLTGVIDEEPGSMGSPILEHIARLDPQTVSSLATELLALRKRVGELEVALLPFVRIADMEERAKPFDSVMVNVDRCRDARTVYNAIHTNEVIEGADFGGDEEDSVPPAAPKEPS